MQASVNELEKSSFAPERERAQQNKKVTPRNKKNLKNNAKSE